MRSSHFASPLAPGSLQRSGGFSQVIAPVVSEAANLAKPKGQAKGSQDCATHLSFVITGRVSVEVIFICAGWPWFAGGGSFL